MPWSRFKVIAIGVIVVKSWTIHKRGTRVKFIS